MPFLAVPHAHLYYEIAGEAGAWVTLVNGHTRTLKDFKLMSKALVTAGFRVLSLDNRGAGLTTYDRPFSIVDMAQDVVRIWDHEGITSSHLLGISMGGMISQHLTATEGTRVEKLVLVSTAASRAFIDDHAEKPWGTTQEAVKEKLAFYFAPAFLARNKLLVDAMAKQIIKDISEGAFTENVTAQRQAMEAFDGRTLLSKIIAPTLILHGAEDRVMDPAAAEELKTGIPNARLTLFPGVGHLLLAEAPKELYERVTTFLLAKT